VEPSANAMLKIHAPLDRQAHPESLEKMGMQELPAIMAKTGMLAMHQQ